MSKIFVEAFQFFIIYLQPIAGGEPAVNGTSGNGAGRASSRGGARGENRPGAGVADLPVTGMAQLSLGTGDARRERRVVSYRDPETKPAHITDKKGMSLEGTVPQHCPHLASCNKLDKMF